MLRPLATAVVLLLASAAPGSAQSAASSPPQEEADANDHRAPLAAGEDGVYLLDLVARPVSWRPQTDSAPAVDVYAFAESGGRAVIPGPFLRVSVGDEVRVRIRNAVPPGRPVGLPPPNRRSEGMATETGPVLFVRGLERALGIAEIAVPWGETVEVGARAREAGDFFYWGTTTGRPLRSRTGPESQLTGLVVVDTPGETRDPAERFFLITMTDAYREREVDPRHDDLFEPAINGRSWPKTERLRYGLGEKVRWRWINGSGFEHPMHLHGFHFRMLETGGAAGRRVVPASEVEDIVTELMLPGTTFRMEWTATREGNWLMHCHIRDHVAGEADPHGHHEAEEHALRAMDGLVMGITVAAEGPPEVDGQPRERLRLVAMERPSERDDPFQGYSLLGSEDVTAGLRAPGPPIVLHRGQTTRITIENRLPEPTNLHWHGLELQSRYDGVSGWSRTRNEVAPLIGPGDTFDVYLAPPRAGSFMYHTHMDATEQLLNGMYGPLIVLEPGERFDRDRDRILLLGYAIDGERRGVSINGRHRPEPMRFTVGRSYRLRFLNMSEGDMLTVKLHRDGAVGSWTPRAKDGADLPEPLRRPREASFFFNAGETYDFDFAPSVAGRYALEIRWDYPTFVGGETLSQPIVVE